MSHEPRLRGVNGSRGRSIYALNAIPPNIIVRFFAHIVYLLSVGKEDLSGDDVSIAFAKAIDGEFHKTPNGLVDVSKNNQAWSIKTVKYENIINKKVVRLISGRNNVLYSYPEEANLRKISLTGKQVIEIWNGRVDEVRSKYSDFRTLVVIRSNDLRHFIIFEEDTPRYEADNYIWKKNSKRNYIAINTTTRQQAFTWQPNGSQFTIHKIVPNNASKFTLRQPETLNEETHRRDLGYNEEWVHFFIDAEE